MVYKPSLDLLLAWRELQTQDCLLAKPDFHACRLLFASGIHTVLQPSVRPPISVNLIRTESSMFQGVSALNHCHHQGKRVRHNFSMYFQPCATKSHFDRHTKHSELFHLSVVVFHFAGLTAFQAGHCLTQVLS